MCRNRMSMCFNASYTCAFSSFTSALAVSTFLGCFRWHCVGFWPGMSDMFVNLPQVVNLQTVFSVWISPSAVNACVTFVMNSLTERSFIYVSIHWDIIYVYMYVYTPVCVCMTVLLCFYLLVVERIRAAPALSVFSLVHGEDWCMHTYPVPRGFVVVVNFVFVYVKMRYTFWKLCLSTLEYVYVRQFAFPASWIVGLTGRCPIKLLWRNQIIRLWLIQRRFTSGFPSSFDDLFTRSLSHST